MSFPTREENILELILAGDEQTVNSVLSRPPLGHSDHCVIDFNVVIKCANNCEAQDAMPEANTKLYNWHNGDYETIAIHLDCTDWNSFICHHPQAASAWSLIYCGC